jgi:hypothetical protein
MKKLFIIALVALASCTPPMVSQPTCNCEEKDSLIKVLQEQLHQDCIPMPGDIVYHDEMMTEGEFQDDTIGQPEY